MAQAEGWRFQVRKAELKDFRVVDEPPPQDLADGEILARIDRFSISANNVLYAMLGEALQYWSLYPAADPSYGVATAWGLGRVTASRHPAVGEGEQLFGLFPMGSHAVLRPADVTRLMFRDASPYRQGAARPYNEYYRVTGNPAFAGTEGDYAVLLRPIFLVSWLAAEIFTADGFYGARTVLITSASSKTGLALAFALRHIGAEVEIVGLTSAGNRAFVEASGLYDGVAVYDEIEQLDPASGAVLYDVAGDGALKARIHRRYGDRLTHSAEVGFAHWDAPKITEALPGPPPEVFFAPDQMGLLRERWGADAFERRWNEATRGYLRAMMGFVRLQHVEGPSAVAAVFGDFLAGRARPDAGCIVRVVE